MADAKETLRTIQAAMAKHWPGVKAQIAREWAQYLAASRVFLVRQKEKHQERQAVKRAAEAAAPASPALADGVSDSARTADAVVSSPLPTGQSSPAQGGKLPLDVWFALLFMLIFSVAMLIAAYIAMFEPQMVADGLKSLNPDLKKQSVKQLFPQDMQYAAAGLFGGFGALAALVIYGLWRRGFRAWTWAIYLMALSMCLLAPVPLAVLVLGSLLKPDVVRLYAEGMRKGRKA